MLHTTKYRWSLPPVPSQIESYIPPAEPAWDRADPAASGLDPQALAEAAAFHQANDSPWPRTMYLPDGRYIAMVHVSEAGPGDAVVGPVRPRGGPNGLILRGGRIVAEWGDTGRADMTMSAAKSYIALLAGIAVGDGLIPDIDQRVSATVEGPWFASPHNAAITWRHLLTQSSEWQGELWGKPDSIDHNRVVGAQGSNTRKGEVRTLQPPGTHFEYNDVRVNALALALLQRFRRPLAAVLKERIMDPIGASPDWEWHGYTTSWVEVDGRRVQSVSGGGHWGGGLFISARDHARMGLMVARDGCWGARRILPAGWVAAMTTATPLNPEYGLLWWLRGDPATRFPSAPADSYFALGGGDHIVWVAPSADLVAVLRWIQRPAVDPFIARVMGALR